MGNIAFVLYLSDMSDAVSIEEFQALEGQKEALVRELDEKSKRMAVLEFELAQLKRLIFGSRRELFKAAEVPEQLSLGFEGAEVPVEAAPVQSEEITYTRKKNANHKGRQPLPEHLPVEDVVIEPEEDVTGMKYIGDEVTETVDYIPGSLIKRRYIRRKYVRQESEEGQSEVVIGELPYRPIEKGIAEAGLLAYLLVSKYVDHLPFYRQIEKFKREHDWNIQKSTLNDWFVACCTLLDPLYNVLKEKVLQTDYLQADESPIKVLDGTKNSSHKAYMWVYRNPVNRLVLFDYRSGRGGEGLETLLPDFKGLLQCDGYAGYTQYARKRNEPSKASVKSSKERFSIPPAGKLKNVTLVSCLAHIRRKFFEAQANHPNLASHALKLIQALYKFEERYREEGLSAEERAARRSTEAKLVFDELLTWVKEQHSQNLSTENIGKALNYAVKELPQLEIYLTDGRVEIDNNLIENAIRPMAIGRKNYLFCGSHEAGNRTAMMYSFFSSCKTMGINPWEWLRDVLQRLGSYPRKQIEDLLPCNWIPPAVPDPKVSSENQPGNR